MAVSPPVQGPEGNLASSGIERRSTETGETNMLRKTLMALAATAALATGTVAATSAAEAKVVIKVHGHHGHHGGYFYGGPYYGGPYYGGYYGGGCVVKPKLVHTPWGPVWKNKTFCY